MLNSVIKTPSNEIYNPLWIRCIFYLGIIGFPSLTGYMLSLSFQAMQLVELKKLAAIPFGLLAINLAYISYVGFTILKFVPAKLYYDSNGFQVDLLSESKWYSWSDIKEIKNNSTTEILRLFDYQGKTIYMLDHMTNGYVEFANTLKKACPTL